MESNSKTMEAVNKAEGFIRTPWLDEKIKEVERLKAEERVEFLLPAEIDHRFFIAELGRPAREYEFGGIYNPKTRSMIVSRGYAQGERGGFSNPAARFVPPRLNNDSKTSDDLFFHTHPWETKAMIGYYNIPQNCCEPSDSDVNNIMAVRQIEENDGFKRKIESIIGSRGYISVTEVSGIDLNADTLLQAGISGDAVQKIKIKLGLAPEIYFKNFAKDQVSESELISILETFYTENISNKETPLRQRIEELKAKVSEYIKQDQDRYGKDSFSRLTESISQHIEYPKNLETTFLKGLGLNDEQANLVQKMSGVKISVYRVKEGIGLEGIK